LKKALILAGGLGKRLRPFTNEVHKSMLQIAGRPLIEWQMQWLKSNGIDEVVICVGYLKEKIIEFVGDGSRFGVNVRYSLEEKTLGTGGAIKNAQHILFPAMATTSSASDDDDDDDNNAGHGRQKEGFFVVNGDILTTISLGKLVVGSSHPTVCAVPMRSPYGVMIIAADDDNNPDDQGDSNVGYKENEEDPYSKAGSSFVTAFLQKPTFDDIWINAGVYYFQKDIFGYLPDVGDFEASVLPLLARQGRLKAVKCGKPDYYWRGIDSHWDLEEAEKEVPQVFQQQK
jgi:NDP-sugar pyrophosphorylase family protein